MLPAGADWHRARAGSSLWHATRKQNSRKSTKIPGVSIEKNSLRLLVVDDEEAARHGIRRALEAFGQEINEAESAEAARALMRDRKFDLLLLDVNLPGISGLEFLTALQTESEANRTEAPLVIIITAHGSERLAVQAVKSGAYDYISKPFELDDLRLVVKNAFETIQLRRENRSLRR